MKKQLTLTIESDGSYSHQAKGINLIEMMGLLEAIRAHARYAAITANSDHGEGKCRPTTRMECKTCEGELYEVQDELPIWDTTQITRYMRCGICGSGYDVMYSVESVERNADNDNKPVLGLDDDPFTDDNPLRPVRANSKKQ